MSDLSQVDLERHLESRSLLGYQIDASHLNDVLLAIIRQLQHSGASSNRRFAQLENAVGDLDRRVGRIEQAFGDVSDASEVRNVREDLRNVMRAVDEIQRQHIPSLQRVADENRHRGLGNEKAISGLNQLVSPLSTQQAQLAQAIDGLGRQLQQLDSREQAERARDRDVADKLGGAVADVGARHARVERDVGALQRDLEMLSRQQPDGRWREALEDINTRMNENFRLVEQGANAVDVELGKLRTDLSNLRAEVNTLDNNTRNKIGRVTDDVDEKFKMLLDTLRAFETNSTAMEEAIASAGKALATNRQNRLSAMSHLGSNSSYGSPSASGFPPSSRGQTATDTSLRGGFLSTDQPSSARRSGGW